MSAVLVVDAACDLPKSYLDTNNIHVLPINIRVNGTLYLDDKDERRLQVFYDKGLLSTKNDAESEPYTTDEILDYLLTNIATKYDFAVIQTVASNNSKIHENAVEASQQASTKYQEIRKIAGKTRKFGIRVFDTGTAFSGQAIVAMYTLDLLRGGISKNQLRTKLAVLKPLVWTYAIPHNISYLRERARKRGAESVNYLSSLIGKTLDINPIICLRDNRNYLAKKVRGRQKAIDQLFHYAQSCIEDKTILHPYIVISYAGDPDDIDEMDSFQSLKGCAERNNVKVTLTIMNLTAGLLLGPEALCVSLTTYTDSL